MKYRTQVAIIALGGLLALPAGLAAAVVSQGTYAGKIAAEIRQQLQSQGYQVGKVETDDDYLEVYATYEGKRYEIKIDPQTGKVIRIEHED